MTDTAKRESQTKSATEQLGAMTKQMGEQVRSTAEQLSTASEQTFVPMLRSYSAWLETAANIQAEALRFTLDQMRKGMDMPARLAECRGPIEMFEVQTDFARGLVADCMSESGKLLSLSLEGLRSSADEATKRAA